jgi:glutamate formiminotransferase / 5-formyltetrahydrofolate cyclo-ligase
MANAKKLLESVPNFSEGRDAAKIDRIVQPFRGRDGVRLLDYQSDVDHNRTVVTIVGEPEAVREALLEAIGAAVEVIDLTRHHGQHPRMGAVDVVPLIPIRNISMAETVGFSKELARDLAGRYNLPIFLYEASASSPARRSLAAIRKGEFEGMPAKLRDPEWQPDFGPPQVHPTAGVTAVGARMPLVAFNVNLATDRMDIANEIALKVRHISGGLRFCKAIGVELRQRGQVQVSMNLTDFSKTAVYRALELVRSEARRYGVNVVGSEIVGLVPMQALIDSAVYYMGLENFSPDQVMEVRLME